MKNKDFNALAKRILPDLPGFVIKSPMVFASPVSHALRGLYFEGSDFDKESFCVWAFFVPLYVPTRHVSFTFGKRLAELGGGTRWKASATNLTTELGAAVKREALPFLSGINSPRAIARAAMSVEGRQNPYVQEALAYSLARAGDIDEAVGALDQLISLLDGKLSWQRDMADRAQVLKDRLVANPSEAQQQLEAWQEESVSNLGLEAFR
jgi:hypothetical protein